MAGLPNLIEEDVLVIETALDDLLRKSEAIAALTIDKGGPLVCERGDTSRFDIVTTAALAAGSFCATQAIAERVGEANFTSIYQQGELHSLLVNSIDDDLLLVVIFKAGLGVGTVKYYAAGTIATIAEQLRKASQRAPGETIDLVSLDSVDAAAMFRRKAAE